MHPKFIQRVLNFSFWWMVTGDGYEESGEVFVFLSFFKFLLLVDGYRRWLREMVTGDGILGDLKGNERK